MQVIQRLGEWYVHVEAEGLSGLGKHEQQCGAVLEPRDHRLRRKPNQTAYAQRPERYLNEARQKDDRKDDREDSSSAA